MTYATDDRRWEQLSAYVDGMLDDGDMATVDRDVRRDSEMADDLMALTRQVRDMQDWADAVVARPVPAGVLAMLRRARAEADAPSSGVGSIYVPPAALSGRAPARAAF